MRHRSKIFVFSILTLCISAGCKFNLDTSVDEPLYTPKFRGINDSGVNRCGDYGYRSDATSPRHNDVDCEAVYVTQTNQSFDSNNDVVPAGQDALFGRDFTARTSTLVKVGAGDAGFDFTKLDDNGDVLDKDASSWACVKDNVTGLVWENKTDSGFRSKSHTYRWYNTDEKNNGGTTGTIINIANKCSTEATRCDTEKYAADVNASQLCGRNNWRLPHKEELSGIVHRGKQSPSIDKNYFNTLGNKYWTSSADAENVDLVYFVSGTTDELATRTEYHQVKLVSGDQFHANKYMAGCSATLYASKVGEIYQDHNNGTVTDLQTELMWAKCPLGLSGANCTLDTHGTAFTANWQQAFDAVIEANEDNYLGFNDWRLPSINELQTLGEPACANPAINKTVFPNTGTNYWTSSLLAAGDHRAWYFSFAKADAKVGGKNSLYSVRLVRGGE